MPRRRVSAAIVPLRLEVFDVLVAVGGFSECIGLFRAARIHNCLVSSTSVVFNSLESVVVYSSVLFSHISPSLIAFFVQLGKAILQADGGSVIFD